MLTRFGYASQGQDQALVINNMQRPRPMTTSLPAPNIIQCNNWIFCSTLELALGMFCLDQLRSPFPSLLSKQFQPFPEPASQQEKTRW